MNGKQKFVLLVIVIAAFVGLIVFLVVWNFPRVEYGYIYTEISTGPAKKENKTLTKWEAIREAERQLNLGIRDPKVPGWRMESHSLSEEYMAKLDQFRERDNKLRKKNQEQETQNMLVAVLWGIFAVGIVALLVWGVIKGNKKTSDNEE